ncbi:MULTISPECIES: MFS transporter [Pandoraea]|uniref:LysR family transcriptional regulator n=1 Tax=Pandoraea thiooxydans TaxID=445709 RepID=A0A0G3ERK1_9BURK|nr:MULTISPECIES: MFS transporter [Pandoraea]MDE2288421.1 MHS family MFS transporter [Burkholderiales bacterium]AKJ69585.1 LysR family transcriptional regulator [Pandoraea thiooxydans]APR97280.1 LysR family transcriptional regulator [Pandoraea thiooxydans]MDE2608240.1 MHS family MFS transporter [Burkholderiales bacterium]TAL57223.1 MAG: MFS transporter [Pandoraea sp.]
MTHPQPLHRTGRQPARAAAAAFVGTTIEWYDFYIYAAASALIFGKLFFPSHEPFFSTLASFGTFAVGFFARPFGGLVFGHLGDRIGRKRALVATLLIMGLGTVGIGFLPTYASAGVLAPVLLVVMRVVQGIAIGGEWGGAVLMAGEHAPGQRRTFLASFAQLGSPAGLILSLLAFRAVTAMDKTAFLDWGWRLPFLASAVLLIVGLLVRLGVNESPEFEAVRRERRTATLPIAEVVRNAWGTVLLCLGANVIGVAGAWFVNAFMLNYTTQTLGLDRTLILDCLFIVAFIQFFTQLASGWLGQRIGPVRFLKAAAALAMLSPYPMFLLVSTGRPAAIVAGIAIAVMCMSSSYAVMAGFMTNAFPVRVRYSAISLSYQLCAALAGGLTPLIGTLLVHQYPGQWWPLALFYSTLAAISLLCISALAMKQSAASLTAGAAMAE